MLDIAHLRDPVAEKPCSAPSSAVFAPALPFYFGAHSRVELPAATTVTRCPPGQRYDADAGRRGLVWTLATTFVANANFELRIPALERRRLLVAPDDISGDILDARTHARARGRVWVPDFAAVCAACPANVTCPSVGEEQPCAGSARIAARTCHPPIEIQTTTAAPPEQTPCPPRAVRYRGTCVCVDDDRWPVPRADLASGFACLRRRQGLLPGTAHIGSVSGGGAVRGPDLAARLDMHDNLLLVYRLVHSATPTVLALGEGEPWQLAGLTTTHAILYRDNVLADLGLVDLTEGGVEVLPVAVPTQQAAAAVNVTREANNSVPLRWQESHRRGGRGRSCRQYDRARCALAGHHIAAPRRADIFPGTIRRSWRRACTATIVSGRAQCAVLPRRSHANKHGHDTDRHPTAAAGRELAPRAL